jgi:thiosulfate/3-mercaptopyruvate sulfurtransferase
MDALTAEATELAPTTYTAKEADLSTYVSMDDVLAVVEDENTSVRIIDTRSQAEHAEGTIPGSILYPHTNNTEEDGTFKSPWTIYLDYQDKGFEREDEIIVYCKSSVRATQTLLLLQEAGYTNVKVYDGAWLEWSTKDAPQVEQETPAATPSAGDAS